MVRSKIELCIICGSCCNKTPLSLMTLSLSGHPSKKDETYMNSKRYVVFFPEIKPTGLGQTVYRQVSTRLEQAPEFPIEFSILFSKVTFHFISE